MKELSIEEKAKRYDEAIKKAKYYYDEGKILEYADNIVSDIFPELKESDDERIRKEIIDIINSYDVAHLKAAGLPSRIPEYIAYLEKQGEQKSAWSEEDDRMYNRIASFIPQHLTAESYTACITWLKSLRPQSQWKPSDEQMNELENEHLKSVPKY